MKKNTFLTIIFVLSALLSAFQVYRITTQEDSHQTVAATPINLYPTERSKTDTGPSAATKIAIIQGVIRTCNVLQSNDISRIEEAIAVINPQSALKIKSMTREQLALYMQRVAEIAHSYCTPDISLATDSSVTWVIKGDDANFTATRPNGSKVTYPSQNINGVWY